jgi:hypothetical protein
MRTVANVVESVRGVIQDEKTPFRYSDQQLITSISDGISEARRIRPDLFINVLDGELPLFTTGNMNESIVLPDTYYVPLVNYVAGRTQLRDDQFSQDGRAVLLISSFGTALNGGKGTR